MKKTNPFPFLFARRGILWLCARRKARMPSGEAARQCFRLAQKILKVPYGGSGGNRTPVQIVFFGQSICLEHLFVLNQNALK